MRNNLLFQWFASDYSWLLQRQQRVGAQKLLGLQMSLLIHVLLRKSKSWRIIFYVIFRLFAGQKRERGRLFIVTPRMPFISMLLQFLSDSIHTFGFNWWLLRLSQAVCLSVCLSVQTWMHVVHGARRQTEFFSSKITQYPIFVILKLIRSPESQGLPFYSHLSDDLDTYTPSQWCVYRL